MSLSFYLYRAAEGLGPLTTWEGNHAQPLGGIEGIKARITALYPEIGWRKSTVTTAEYWSGLGDNRPGQPYLDLSVSTASLEAGGPSDQVYFIVGRKMPPSIMRTLMEALDLNHVCCVDAGVLVDPYAYTDEDRYYAKKAWPRP
jgi:hypothetical protein